MAYTIGEEAFIDLNGNGVADPGEFTDTSEAFRDDNENGVRDPNETFIDFNGDGVFNGPDGKYNGVLQGAAYIGAPKSKDIFSNTVIIMSSGTAIITPSTNSIVSPGGAFTVTVTDINGNTMPSGTTIVTTAPFGVLTGPTNFTVPQNTGFGVPLLFNISPSSSPTVQSGVISITVTSPDGIVSPKFINLSGAF